MKHQSASQGETPVAYQQIPLGPHGVSVESGALISSRSGHRSFFVTGRDDPTSLRFSIP
jgi:hypothetical protein